MKNLVMAVAALLSLGQVSGAAAQAPQAVEVVRAPVTAYGALPAIQQVDVSPDGRNLAFLRTSEGRSSVLAVARDGTPLVEIDTSDRRVRSVSWASPDHVIIASASTQHVPFFRGRSEIHVLDIVNVRTQRAERAMKSTDRRSYNAALDWDIGVYGGKPTLFVQAVTENPGQFSLDVYRVDLDTGRGRIHAEGVSDTQGYILRRNGDVAARIAYNPENGRWRLSAKSGSGWRDIHQVRALLDRPAVYGFGRTADTLAVADEVEGEWRLMEVSLADGSDRSHIDLGAAPNRILRDADGLLVGVGFLDTYQDYSLISPPLAEAWAVLKESLPGRQLKLTSYSDDQSVIVFYVEGTGEPGAYYLYDAGAKRVSLVGRAYPDLANVEIAEVQIVRYKAKDGLDLMGYLTLPPGRARANLPLVVMPHGGPAARDEPGYDWWAQAMASRGYVVFQPQFRGSDGFGEAFLQAGYGEWGRKMQTDLSDGVRHLAERGLIDPSRVCITGASYGGYAALAGATMESDVYRCAVAVAGVSDLREMLLESERKGARGDANPTVRYWKRFMGAESVSDRSIDAYSPARLVSGRTSPVLLIHGRNDTIVPFNQSQIMATALQGAGKLVPLEGEDHYLSLSSTRQKMLTETLSFLEQHNPAWP